MIKSTALVLVSVFMGWVFRGIYVEEIVFSSKKKREALSDVECEESSPEVIEKIVEKEVVRYLPQTKIVYKVKEEDNKSKDPFLMALVQKKFYKAMAYYEEANEEKHPSYKNTLIGYFRQEQVNAPWRTVEEIQYFIDMETENKKFVFLLSRIFVNLGLYKKALDVLIDFSYSASLEDIKLFHLKIKSISMVYINKLMVAKDYKELVTFLLNRINMGVLSEFYSYELAKVYVQLKKYIQAQELLEILKDNDIYKERAVELLNYIDKKLEEIAEYPIQIPLIRSGTHFLVKAYVNKTEVLLLLDTGASITTVNYELVKNLEVLEKDVLFNTANGKMYSTIFNAYTFTIDSVVLNNFHVVGGIASGGETQGLLGMNFLGRYKFKIDQKEAILFLGKKY